MFLLARRDKCDWVNRGEMGRKKEKKFRDDALSEVRQGARQRERGYEGQVRGEGGCIIRVCDGGLSLTPHVVSTEPQRSEAES